MENMVFIAGGLQMYVAMVTANCHNHRYDQAIHCFWSLPQMEENEKQKRANKGSVNEKGGDWR